MSKNSFGPGVAKDELKKRLDENGLGDQIAGIETVAMMTTPRSRRRPEATFPDRVRCREIEYALIAGENNIIISRMLFSVLLMKKQHGPLK